MVLSENLKVPDYARLIEKPVKKVVSKERRVRIKAEGDIVIKEFIFKQKLTILDAEKLEEEVLRLDIELQPTKEEV